jgi:serine protease AprX
MAAGLLVGSTLVVPEVTAAATPNVALDPTQKIHPLLQYGAQVDPSAVVRVIVQKNRSDVTSASLLAGVPGVQIGEDFKYIPAFVANLPQASVATLAANPSVRYVSPDASVQVLPSVDKSAAKPAPRPPAPKPAHPPKHGFDPSGLRTVYPFVSGATQAWTGAATPDHRTDSGVNISVAVIDSGVDANLSDVGGQVLAVNVNRKSNNAQDGFGHGTHVAAIINGHDADGQYYGIAPSATVISVKIADDQGNASESDLLRGLDWVRANRDAYHIRAVNLSVSSGVASSYAVSPVDAAVERLWNDNVVVVAAAGNLGSAEDAVWYAPGNDPYAITVGCLDDNQTANTNDDSLCSISSRGITEDGFAKPDLVASGRKVESALSTGVNGNGSVLAGEFPERISADGHHIRLSGTSMSTPVVTGAVALLLQRHAGLRPSQIRQLLTGSTTAYPGQPDHAGALNIPAALNASDHPPAPDTYTPVPASGAQPAATSSTILWDGSRWASTYYDGSRWASTYLDGSRWAADTSLDGSRWAGTSLDGSRWATAYWDGSRWASAYWDGSRWASSTEFDGSRWASAYWDGSRWASAYWDGSRWAGSAWDSIGSLD